MVTDSWIVGTERGSQHYRILSSNGSPPPTPLQCNALEICILIPNTASSQGLLSKYWIRIQMDFLLFPNLCNGNGRLHWMQNINFKTRCWLSLFWSFENPLLYFWIYFVVLLNFLCWSFEYPLLVFNVLCCNFPECSLYLLSSMFFIDIHVNVDFSSVVNLSLIFIFSPIPGD